MKKRVRIAILACAVIGVLCGSGCVSRRKYKACEDQLKQAKSGSSAATFTVTINNDGFAQFMPLNNQFWGEPKPTKYYGGFLVQLATMKKADHVYSNVDLTLADGTTRSLGRSEVGWMDIVCEASPGHPIDKRLAGLLMPDGTTAGEDHVLHRSMEKGTVSLLTMWRAADGLSAESSPSADNGPDHGHDQFVFSSPVDCGVEVWRALADSAPTVTYTPGQVKAVRVKAGGGPAPHGGVHEPWWSFGTNE